MLISAGFDTDTAAGVHPGYAVLASLAYRVAFYWLPCCPGRRPTCSSATATDGPFASVPRLAGAANRDRELRAHYIARVNVTRVGVTFPARALWGGLAGALRDPIAR